MIQSNFPVILYDIENKPISINCISKTNSFFFRSYQLFSVEIIENNISDNLIYSVTENPTPSGPDDLFIISSAKSFSNVNFGYTLYITENCKIKVVGIDNTERFFNIIYQPDNVLSNEQEHYDDLLTNNNLPNYTELEPAIISEEKADMIKRLLLDFKHIISKKGTKEGITKFLNLIGFNPESIKVFDVYKTPNNSETLSPNKLQDIKTGYYHVLYDNWIIDDDEPYTIKNLPKRIININDLDEFFKKLWYAIVLANKYFTLPEQDITFFGLSNSVNIEKYFSVAGNTSIINFIDVHNFRKKLHIDIYNHEDFVNKTYLVRNNLQINLDTYNTEIKYLKDSTPPNDELYLVDLEIFDDYIPEDIDQLQIKSIFGNLLHLTIDSPNTYCEYIIEKIDNEFTKIVSDKIWLDDILHLRIVSKLSGNYKVTIFIYDIHNNREKYTFNYTISNDISRIDFDVYNSTNLLENDLSTDIESSWLITDLEQISNQTTNTYILPLSNVPLSLDTYYEQDLIGLSLRYLFQNERLRLPKINQNFIVNRATETIPVDYMDNFLHVVAIPYNPDYKLQLRCVNDLTQKIEFLDYHNALAYTSNPDKLFITIMDILNTDTDELNPFIFISTIEAGIDIIQQTYDLFFVNKNDANDKYSIFGINELTQAKIPVNYDFPLFFRTSTLVSNLDFVSYPTYIQFVDENTDYTTLTTIKSIYPRLINIKSNQNTYDVKLGDIIFCRTNPIYITNHTDIKWTVLNSFTDEEILTSNDYVLKFRVEENIIYTIILEFIIEGITYTINKKSIQSSFEM